MTMMVVERMMVDMTVVVDMVVMVVVDMVVLALVMMVSRERTSLLCENK